MAPVEGPAEDIAIALLAAGRSERFGVADKRRALLGGRPLIAWAARSALAIPAGWHLLVTGPDESFEDTAPGYRPLVNSTPEQGLATSLRIAAREAERLGAAALLILLADMPFVPPAHLARLIAAFRTDPARPVFSRGTEGPAQPPALFPAARFGALQAMQGDAGARSLATDAILLDLAADHLIDIDTPADLARANDRTQERTNHDDG